MDDDSSGEFEGNHEAQEDEDEGSEDERQVKHVKQSKAAKKATLAKVAVISVEEDLQIEFQVPRHVPNHGHLDDENAYKVMVAAAIKCKDPKINLAVENDGKVSDAEDNKKKKKKKGHKEIPSENDISAPNAEINAKIGLLRTKYTCYADDGSDYCWVSGEEKQHIALGHAHFNLWAAAWPDAEKGGKETKANAVLPVDHFPEPHPVANKTTAPKVENNEVQLNYGTRTKSKPV
ncbi:hypothetical protein B0H14DRAFT_2592096 [Mycena olivaceomarginata]|nr:hypothetical protein B0H14DRAFT_2592096 [Mycena olivaceomarginata]